MRFDRDTILNLDESDFSPAEKRHLLDRFFPALPKPMEELLVQWRSAKRWGRYLDNEWDEPHPNSLYRVPHEALVNLAKHLPPQRVGNTVTAFSGWIFSLYRPILNKKSLDDGRRIERAIARRFAPVPTKAGWELVFEDPLTEKPEVKKISALQINESPIWGVPDLVFREKATGKIVIIERKASNREIPSDGWPNLRAQLWAYSQIDEWRNAPAITLVGEIWGFTSDQILLRGTLRWKACDDVLRRQNTELFTLFGGTVA